MVKNHCQEAPCRCPYSSQWDHVETCNQKNGKGRTARAERVAENKRKTYAEAVKRYNNTALKEVAEDLIK